MMVSGSVGKNLRRKAIVPSHLMLNSRDERSNRKERQPCMLEKQLSGRGKYKICLDKELW